MGKGNIFIFVLHAHEESYQQSSKILRSTYTSNVHEYYFIDFQLHQHEYNYFNYSSRLVSTRKLVEDGSRVINN
jgi:hypothetical protein